MTGTTIEFEQVVEIINSSDLEDIVILDETYEHLLEELADSDEKMKYVRLHDKTQARIKQLV